jgi:hypothetical protein
MFQILYENFSFFRHRFISRKYACNCNGMGCGQTHNQIDRILVDR